MPSDIVCGEDAIGVSWSVHDELSKTSTCRRLTRRSVSSSADRSDDGYRQYLSVCTSHGTPRLLFGCSGPADIALSHWHGCACQCGQDGRAVATWSSLAQPCMRY